ncbi:arsenate reductase ArsC [Variovorax sp. LARHSF232]
MASKTYNVLFICTGNSARSILAEALLNEMGGGRFRAYSAGSDPKGQVNPFAIKELQSMHISFDGLRSKSWEEFARPDAPQMDFIFTVCDDAAGEVCPLWPGQPVSAHWGMPDPAAVGGSDEDKRKAFRETAVTIRRRLELMLALPLDRLEKLAVHGEMQHIGQR